MQLSIKVTGGEKVAQALRKLSGPQAQQAYAAALKDVSWEARRAIQTRMKSVFDRPTPFVLKSVQVEVDEKDLTARILPTYFGNQPVDPQQILHAQAHGGQRAAKRFEIVLQQTGYLPAGWYAVPGQGANLDRYGNISRGQLVQILSQLRAKTTAGYGRNMAFGKKSIKAQERAGGRFFVIPPGGRTQPGVYQREFFGRGITPVLIFVPRAIYKPRINMDDIARNAKLQEYFERRIRYRLYKAAEELGQ